MELPHKQSRLVPHCHLYFPCEASLNVKSGREYKLMSGNPEWQPCGWRPFQVKRTGTQCTFTSVCDIIHFNV